ncbi:MAG: hypothetical protein SPD11_03070 [Sphaerochaetaceae bacterium]|nr:hypothetical protein [Sphaerochaetaceae bacterium]
MSKLRFASESTAGNAIIPPITTFMMKNDVPLVNGFMLEAIINQ